jgi:hypothetical protein
MRDCAYMPIHMKDCPGSKSIKALASETHQILSAGGVHQCF